MTLRGTWGVASRQGIEATSQRKSLLPRPRQIATVVLGACAGQKLCQAVAGAETSQLSGLRIGVWSFRWREFISGEC